MKGAAASLEAYWSEEAPELGLDYAGPQDLIVLFSQATTTGCGNASSATGPFYCPPDQTIYIDMTLLRRAARAGSAPSGGPLAEMYVVAHEWGHHIQNLAGILERSQDGQTGPTSNAVRIELQADCFAGAWAADASRGRPTRAACRSCSRSRATDRATRSSAAAAVGDDRIQEATQGQVNPHSFTHGTSEQRRALVRDGLRAGRRRLRHVLGRGQL